MKNFSTKLQKFILALIRIYQKVLSFDHAFWAQPHKFRVCIHHPSCSEYTYKAVERFGVVKGLRLGLFRILKCNVFFSGGVDPVPEK